MTLFSRKKMYWGVQDGLSRFFFGDFREVGRSFLQKEVTFFRPWDLPQIFENTDLSALLSKIIETYVVI